MSERIWMTRCPVCEEREEPGFFTPPGRPAFTLDAKQPEPDFCDKCGTRRVVTELVEKA